MKASIPAWLALGFVAALPARTQDLETIDLRLWQEPLVQQEPAPLELDAGPSFGFAEISFAGIRFTLASDWFIYGQVRETAAEDRSRTEHFVGGLNLRIRLFDGCFFDIGSGAGIQSADTWKFLLSFDVGFTFRVTPWLEIQASSFIGATQARPFARNEAIVVSTDALLGLVIRL